MVSEKKTIKKINLTCFRIRIAILIGEQVILLKEQ